MARYWQAQRRLTIAAIRAAKREDYDLADKCWLKHNQLGKLITEHEYGQYDYLFTA